jgi:hypothetical protein
MRGYNGWRNYETWNVALWIGNDESLYEIAMRYANSNTPYRDFVSDVEDWGMHTTPDGVAWNDPRVSIREVGEMIAELG